MSENQPAKNSSIHKRWLTPARLAFVQQLRAVDTSWDPCLIIALARAAADDIEQLCDTLLAAEKMLEALNV